MRARTARETNSRSLSLSLSPLLDQWLNRIGVGEGGAESGSGGYIRRSFFFFGERERERELERKRKIDLS